MEFKIDDVNEIRERLSDIDFDIPRDLVLIAGLPGAGKTTLAKEFVKQTEALHFDMDQIKRIVVPPELVVDEIDPPELRYTYYAETIRKLPELFAENPSQTVVIDETFPVKDLRELWEEAAKELNIKTHWIEVVCDEDCVKERLSVGKGRENHILGDKAFPMYCKFKEAFEPMEAPFEVVDATLDIEPQVREIINDRSLKKK